MTDRHAPLAERIDALLPQTQCRQCGFDGCMPYAEAIAAGTAPINRCPPGGESGIEALAQLVGTAVLPLDPDCGTEHPRQLARIIEADCIGCTKCIQACPVDAIVGTSKRMHSVLPDQCTGCELCVPACPVDCIELLPMSETQLDQAHADAGRRHYRQRNARLARLRAAREAELAARKAEMDHRDKADDPRISRAAVLAAIARGRAKRKTDGGAT